MNKMYLFASILLLSALSINQLSADDISTGAPLYETSFENQLYPWFTNRASRHEWSSEISHTGSKSLKIIGTGEGFIAKDPDLAIMQNMGQWINTKEIKVESGELYNISCYVSGQLEKGSIGFRMYFYDKNKKLLSKDIMEVRLIEKSPEKWECMGAEFKVPPKAEYVKVAVAVWNFKGKIYFDDLSVKKGAWKVTIPFDDRKIVVDGKLDSAEWQNSLVINNFVQLKSFVYPWTNAHYDTIIYIKNDWSNLYLGCICNVSDESKIRKDCIQRDSGIWKDDCIEIFIDFEKKQKSYVHYIINSGGIYYDSFCLDGAHNSGWDSDIKTASKIEKGKWILELAIPLKYIGLNVQDNPARELPVSFNICRENHVDKENSTWVPLGAASFHRPERFVNAVVSGNTTTRSQKQFSFKNKCVSFAKKKTYQRVWKSENPLDRELISENPKKYQGEASFIWGTPLNPISRQISLQYGIEWLLLNIATKLCKQRMHYIANYWQWKWWPKSPAEKYDCLWWKSPHANNANSGNASYKLKYSRGWGFETLLLDSANSEAYIVETKKLIKELPLWAISMGDEVIYWDSKKFFDFKKKYGNKYEFIKNAGIEIREKYGFGKFDAPESITEKSPFKWIAFWRWYLGKYVELTKKFSEAAKSANPRIITISDNPPNGLKAYHLSRQGAFLNIFTGQLFPNLDKFRQTFGFETKLISDLSGKATWPCPHIENYAASLEPEEVNSLLSESVRCGAEGFQLFLSDCAAELRGAINVTPFCYYGHRPRWLAIEYILGKMRRMNKLAFPVPDAAVLFSEDTCHTGFKASKFQPFYESLFTVIGPHIKGWFKFISDIQIADRQVDLSMYKVIFIPSAKYERKEVQEALISYVENGGILVLFDSEAFSFGIDGSSTSSKRKSLTGTEIKKSSCPQNIYLATKENGLLKLPATATRYELSCKDNVKTLAFYENGKAFLVKNKLGHGSVYYFAANPLGQSLIYSDAWIAFFRKMYDMLGLEKNHDIWRFKFNLPEFKIQNTVNGTCITNNYFKWILNEPVKNKNSLVKNAFYYYSGVKPDLYTEPEKCSFKTGKLTDRCRAINQKIEKKGWSIKEADAPSAYVVGWKSLNKGRVVFDFGKKFPISGFRIFCSGDIPRIKVKFGVEKYSMSEQADFNPENEYTIDVKKIEKWYDSPIMARFIAFEFGERKEKEFILSEIDIWKKQYPKNVITKNISADITK